MSPEALALLGRLRPVARAKVVEAVETGARSAALLEAMCGHVERAIGDVPVEHRADAVALVLSCEILRLHGLLDECERHLREHDAEYHHRTPPELLAKLRGRP